MREEQALALEAALLGRAQHEAAHAEDVPLTAQPDLERPLLPFEERGRSAGEPQLHADRLAGDVDADLEEAASTRLLVYTIRLIQAGYDPVEACRNALIEPLTDDIETTDALMEVVYATFGR